MVCQRPGDRRPDEMRPVRFEPHFTRSAFGSVLACCGETQVLCTAIVLDEVPPFLEGTGRGWLTAEYRMLPGATPGRHKREWQKLSGRTQEIQRLIGRSLRASLDLSALGPRTIYIDADVLQADAGTRTTSITGGYIALALAVRRLLEAGKLENSPLLKPVAAVSVGAIADNLLLDLDYREDSTADVDFNVVMNGDLQLIEVQGTAENGSFSRPQLERMLDLAQAGITMLLAAQAAALTAA
ncbi:ribonuclease PH [Rubidibacter lacunae KORDI 51-2]|uniref:Ribonuclease PH n=1 Tax=Rubidibacter lacunae KORDI 51-2 TaxID=582515 RepID=U5DGT0_9CHRO|nr:ribonuclease PH [Rubidibacter lacunae]ERN40477.1 ribonuclease PH [Rubidibacter lacunae KORDI 51-2]